MPVIRRVAGVAVTPADFDLARLPAHLHPAFAVTDAPRGRRGTPQEVGRDTDLAALQARFADRARSSAARVVARPAPGSAPIERTGMTTWDLDELPRVLDTRAAGGVVRAYPALVDTGAAVDVRLLATPEEQAASTRAGVHRLLALATPSPAAYVRDHLTGAEKLALGASPYRSTDALFQDCFDAVVDRVQLRVAPDGVAWDRATLRPDAGGARGDRGRRPVPGGRRRGGRARGRAGRGPGDPAGDEPRARARRSRTPGRSSTR